MEKFVTTESLENHTIFHFDQGELVELFVVNVVNMLPPEKFVVVVFRISFVEIKNTLIQTVL